MASVDVAPRVVMLMSRADTWVMLMPGTARSRSPTLVAGEFSMVAVVITVTAAGAFTSCSSDREAVTMTCSSKVTGLSGSWEGCCAAGCWFPCANAG